MTFSVKVKYIKAEACAAKKIEKIAAKSALDRGPIVYIFPDQILFGKLDCIIPVSYTHLPSPRDS